MVLNKITLPVARKIAGLTQKDLAAACKVSEATISNWERGKTEPTISQAEIAAAACGFSYDDIKFLP